MRRKIQRRFVIFLAVVLCTSILPFSPPSEARYNSGFYMQQQMRRQQQMQMQRQQQIRMQQQRAQQRRQQEAMRQQRQRQQQAMRQRQRQMQIQMQQRQKMVMRQRQQMMVKQRKIQQQRQLKVKDQKRTQSQKVVKQRKVVQQRQVLRQQRLVKSRQERLRRLQKERRRKLQVQNKTKTSRSTATIAAMSSRFKANLGSTRTITKPTIKQFRSTRLNQQKQLRTSKQLVNQRKLAKVRMQKIRESQKRLQAKKVAESKSNKQQTKTQKLAAKNFKTCKGSNCNNRTAGVKKELPKQISSPRQSLLNSVTDKKLRRRIDKMYRVNAKVGSGSTADAIRHELKTGKLLSKKGHFQKGIEMRNGLMKDIKSGRLNKSDTAIAKGLAKDLQDALSGQ